jgi:tetratricopeptide (TPR) repeat protein
LPLEPDSEKISSVAFNHYINGTIFEELGDLEAAGDAYKAALQIYPKSYEIRFAMAAAYLGMQRHKDVLDILEPIEPQDLQVWNVRAACYRTLGMDDSAKFAYLSLIDIAPDETQAYSYLAGYYRREDNIDSTRWAYENLVRLRPDNYRLLAELARLQILSGDIETGKETFRQSIEVEPGETNLISYVGLGESYELTDQLDSAIQVFNEGIEVDSLNLVLNRKLVGIYLSTNEPAKALPHARQVVNVSPEDIAAQRRLGSVYYAVDSLDAARKIFELLISAGDRHAANHYYLGRIDALQDDFEGAAVQFRALTQIADTLYESWLDLGYAYRELGDQEKELLTYRTGLNHMKNESSAIKLLFSLGAAYERYGQFDKATETFEELIARNPEDAQSLNYLGYMLADRGDSLQYARELIERAVRIAPDNAAYLDSYGWVLYRMGKYQDALVHLRKAVSLDNDPVILDHLGDALNATGQTDEAREWWQKALEQQPENESIKEKLGQ